MVVGMVVDLAETMAASMVVGMVVHWVDLMALLMASVGL